MSQCLNVSIMVIGYRSVNLNTDILIYILNFIDDEKIPPLVLSSKAFLDAAKLSRRNYLGSSMSLG